MSERELEVYKAYRDHETRYVYFLLAAAGAAIAFAVNTTGDTGLQISQIPLGAAVVLWGLSFFFGCRWIGSSSSVLFSNHELLKVQGGTHPMAGRHPQAIAIAEGVLREAIQEAGEAVQKQAKKQLWTLYGGAVFFLLWRLIEMWLWAAPTTS